MRRAIALLVTAVLPAVCLIKAGHIRAEYDGSFDRATAIAGDEEEGAAGVHGR